MSTSWKTKPLSVLVARLPFQKTYSAAEFAVIARGNIPESMDDRWFAYMQEGVLYIHRSWTGIGIYQVSFQEEGGCYVVKEALAERGSAEYDSADAEYDAAIVSFLIDGWLGKSPRFPPRPQK
ncbi:MAG: hypothetical protein ABSF71_09245 [Terriglobia bacterium]